MVGEFARVSRLNVANRTLAITDNLPFLRSLNNECIDLIAIDPPFAANETFKGVPKPAISKDEYAEEVALAKKHGVTHNEGIGETRVKDIWSWDADINPAWKEEIKADYTEVHKVIEAVEACATENEAAYICFMAIRLLQCRRVLKPTGSIYVHCDPHANSYLRMTLDAIFGADNFRNEIIWCYTGPSSTKRWFPRKHDTVLYYVKSPSARFYQDDIRVPYKMIGIGKGDTIFKDGDNRERVEELLKKGKVPNDWWADDHLTNISAWKRERTGYATQKPLALYERIIKASTSPGAVVLDIFAGCATTAVAAERTGREWVACDMAYRSATMLKRRFYLNGFQLEETTNATIDALASVVKDKTLQTRQQFTKSIIIGPNDLPERDDVDPDPYHHLQQSRRRGQEPNVQTSDWSGRIAKDEAKDLLIGKFGPQCWGCGYQPRRPNGSYDLTLLEVDHIRARRAAQGKQGGDELYNLAVLHRTCNGIKGNRLTLEELRQHNALHGLLYVDSLNDLVDLYEALEFAQEQIAARPKLV